VAEDPHYVFKYPLAGSRIPVISISAVHMPNYLDSLGLKLGLTYHHVQVQTPIANAFMCLV